MSGQEVVLPRTLSALRMINICKNFVKSTSGKTWMLLRYEKNGKYSPQRELTLAPCGKTTKMFNFQTRSFVFKYTSGRQVPTYSMTL